MDSYGFKQMHADSLSVCIRSNPSPFKMLICLNPFESIAIHGKE